MKTILKEIIPTIIPKTIIIIFAIIFFGCMQKAAAYTTPYGESDFSDSASTAAEESAADLLEKGAMYMKYTRDMIIRRFNAGEKLKIIAFWGHTPNPGKMTKTCFSQWYACKFEVDGVMYHTAEQYMMAQKAILMGDTATCREIMAAFNPREYKKLGRKVRNFDPVLWDREKYNVVLRGNLAKFSQNPRLLEFLDSTGDSVLVEGSPYDAIWGVKLESKDPRVLNPNQWRGENLLGFALMETRDILRERRQNK